MIRITITKLSSIPPLPPNVTRNMFNKTVVIDLYYLQEITMDLCIILWWNEETFGLKNRSSTVILDQHNLIHRSNNNMYMSYNHTKSVPQSRFCYTFKFTKYIYYRRFLGTICHYVGHRWNPTVFLWAELGSVRIRRTYHRVESQSALYG